MNIFRERESKSKSKHGRGDLKPDSSTFNMQYIEWKVYFPKKENIPFAVHVHVLCVLLWKKGGLCELNIPVKGMTYGWNWMDKVVTCV